MKLHKQNPKPFSSGFTVPGGVLLSHGKPTLPSAHRRSLLSSVWGQVGPPLYRRQDYSFYASSISFFLLSLSLFTTKQADSLQNFLFIFLSFVFVVSTTLKNP